MKKILLPGVLVAVVLFAVHEGRRVEVPASALAFSSRGAHFAAQGPELAVAVEAGAVAIAQRGTTTTFSTRRVSRGGERLDAPVAATTCAGDELQIARGRVHERLRNDARGVEQSWRLDALPPGRGALRVEVETSGRLLTTSPRGFHFEGGLTYGHATWVEATGRRTPIEGRWVADAIDFVVPEEVLEASAYPAVLDPLISAEFDVDPAVALPAWSDQLTPAVAWSGSQHLLAWSSYSRFASDEWDVFAARVDSTGNLTDPFGLVVSTGATTVDGVSVASDGAGFLVVWLESRGASFSVRAARVSSAGALLDATPITVITSTNLSRPRVAFAGGVYLVVWNESRVGNNDVFANRVSAAGAVLDGSGFVIGGLSTQELAPVVGSNGTEFLVAWEDYRGSGDVYASRVTSAGNVVTPNGFAVSTAANDQSSLAIAWNGGAYLVAWSDYRNSVREIYGAFVTSTGVVLPNSTTGLAIAAGGAHSRFAPSVAAYGTHPTGAPFLVTWSDGRNSSVDVYGARVSDGGAVLDVSNLWLTDAGDSQDNPVVAANGTSALVAWVDQRAGSGARDIWAEVVGSNGVITTPAAIKSFFANDEWEPAVASSGSIYFAVWIDCRQPRCGTPNSVYGIRLSDAGVPLDPAAVLISSAGATPRLPEVVWVSQANQFMVVWSDSRDGGDNLYGARITAAGTNLDPDGVAISSAPGSQFQPTLASDGTRSLVAWHDTRNIATFGTDVYAAFFLPDAGVWPSAAAGLVVVNALSEQSSPAAAWNGADFFVTWTDSRSLAVGEEIFAARITDAGVVRDPSGVSITSSAPGTSNQRYSAVTAVGSNFVVAFNDDRAGPGEYDVYSVRVDPTGPTLTTTAPVAVATGTDAQRFPAIASDGTDAFIVWETSSNGILNSTRGARVTGAGVLRDPSPGLSISPGVVAFGSKGPRIAAGGPRTFLSVAWTAQLPPANGVGGRTRARLLTNTPPVANAVNTSTNEDSSATILLSGSDADGDATTVTVQSGPAHGSLSGTPPAITYTPAANYNGPDSFTFVANDGAANSVAGTVSITVLPVNDAPVAQAQAVSTQEDTGRAITLAASDLETASLSFSIGASPSSGMLSGTPPNVTYTPSPNFNGVDTFTFTASDGVATSAPVTVTVTVLPVNDAPVANGQMVSATEDTPKAIALSGTDAEGASLTYVVTAQPSNGALSGSPPNVVYTPVLNFAGNDTFSFKVNDGLADSTIAVVSIAVTGVNDVPVATGANLGTNQDTPLLITLQATDVETSSLTYSIVTPPAHGAVTGTGAQRTYTPTTGFVGADSFTFKAFDGTVDSNTVTINISVGAVNHPPVATPQSLTTPEDTALQLTLSGTDPDNDPLTFNITAPPTHGTIGGVSPNLTYTPHQNYVGSDSFTFRASDGTLDSSMSATVSITVQGTNDAPTATGQSLSLAEDSMATPITLAATDPDANPLTFTITAQPLHGTLSGTPPLVAYTPNPDYAGLDAFSFKANDGTLDSNQAQVMLTITQVNDTPLAQPQNLNTQQDTPLNILLTGTDLDGNLLTFTVLTQPSHGALSGSPPNITYTPQAGYRGMDTFTFRATDGLADSAPAAIGISVAAVNHAPVATSQQVTTPEDVALGVTLAGSDQDGDALSFSVVVQPQHGTLTGAGAALTYTPNANFFGTDTFQFRASDGVTNSTDATVRVDVTEVGDAPTAAGQTVTTNEDSAVSIVLGGDDPDGPPPTFIVLEGPQQGTLSGNAPNLNFTPRPDFAGTDQFTFQTTDGTNTSAPAVVNITVAPVNDLPVAEALQLSTTEATPVALALKGTDVEGQALVFAVASGPAHGEVSGTPPDLTYSPEAGFTGTDTFTFTANDGVAASLPATVSITVTPGATVTRDTTRLNGWSCGCSSSTDAPTLWVLALGVAWAATRRSRGRRGALALAVAVVALTASAAPAKKTPRKAPEKVTPAPTPAPEPVLVAPAPAPVVVEPVKPVAPKGPPLLAALDVAVTVPNEQLDGAAFTEMLTSAVDQSKLFRVISAREVATMLGIERQKALLGCSEDTSCMTELADALGSEFVLQGAVGKVGETYLITVRLIDSRKARVVGRSSNQTADANLLLNLIWKSTQQTLDAWGASLPPDEQQRVAGRPQVAPAAAAAPPASRIGVIASAVGSYQPLAAEGSRASVGGEVAAVWRLNRFELGAGIVISPTPGGRVFATVALLTGDNRVAVGLRGSGFPGANTWGGGPVVEYERALGKVFAVRAHVAGEAYGSPGGLVLAVLGGLGAAARF